MAESASDERSDRSTPESEFEVHSIKGESWKLNEITHQKCIHYKVRWKNFGPAHDTWEPLAHLSNAMDIVNEWNSSGKRKKYLRWNPLPSQAEVKAIKPPGKKEVVKSPQQASNVSEAGDDGGQPSSTSFKAHLLPQPPEAESKGSECVETQLASANASKVGRTEAHSKLKRREEALSGEDGMPIKAKKSKVNDEELNIPDDPAMHGVSMLDEVVNDGVIVDGYAEVPFDKRVLDEFSVTPPVEMEVLAPPQATAIQLAPELDSVVTKRLMGWVVPFSTTDCAKDVFT